MLPIERAVAVAVAVAVAGDCIVWWMVVVVAGTSSGARDCGVQPAWARSLGLGLGALHRRLALHTIAEGQAGQSVSRSVGRSFNQLGVRRRREMVMQLMA